jgi:hypothetical protein
MIKAHYRLTLSNPRGRLVSVSNREVLMPLYSIPRRPFRPQTSEPSAPINWRRGMIRIWFLISAAWVMSWVIYLIMGALETGLRPSDLLVIPVLLFGPPVALLLFGAATAWAFRGFKVDEPPADNDR